MNHLPHTLRIDLQPLLNSRKLQQFLLLAGLCSRACLAVRVSSTRHFKSCFNYFSQSIVNNAVIYFLVSSFLRKSLKLDPLRAFKNYI